MKRVIFVLIALLCLAISSFSQEKGSELLDQRNQYFQRYKSFKDTMTIRTWLNMVELSKRLEAVVEIDNMLLDSLLLTTPVDANVMSRLDQLLTTRDQLVAENARLNKSLDSLNKQNNTFLFIIILVSLIFLIILISWISYVGKIKRMERSSGKLNERMLSMKQTHKEEVDELKKEIEKLQGDQLLMENSTEQIKKSYDILKSRSESVKETPNDKQVDDEALSEVRKEMEELTTEVSLILKEKKELEEELEKVKKELEGHQDTRKSVEDELENLLKKFKNKPD